MQRIYTPLRLAQALQRGADPARVLVLTYTETAVQAFQDALTHIGLPAPARRAVQVSTFEAFCSQRLRALEGCDTPTLLAPEQRRPHVLAAIARVQQRMDEPYPEALSIHDSGEASVEGLLASFEYLKGTLLLHTEAADRRLSPALAAELGQDYMTLKVLRAYEHIRRGGHPDHPVFRGPQDATYDLACLLRDDEGWLGGETGQDHPLALGLQLLLVDEMHDTNRAMFTVLREVMKRNHAGFVGVGDRDQVIHSLAGADATFMGEAFDREVAPATRLPLSTSWRFGPRLATAAGHLAHHKPYAAQATRDTEVALLMADSPADQRWQLTQLIRDRVGLPADAPLADVLELTNIVMLFLLVVVGVALRFGRGPAVMAAILGVAFFDLFFVPPRFTFAVSDAQYLVTFAVMLVVALVVGQLTAGLKVQAESATEREHRVRSLYDMARDLSAALLPEQVAEIGARFMTGEFNAGSTLVVADDDNRLQILPGGSAPVDMAVAQWAFERGEPAGRGTDTLHSSPTLVLPLKAPMRIRGVLVVAMPQGQVPGVEPRRLLQTCASLLAISLERIHYIDVAQKSTVQIESERLRNSLLSAISHDLRTPLASLVGLAESLAMVQPPLPAHQQELTGAIQQSAQRMSALVNNLLDMARLEAGAVQLNKAWQPLEEVVGSALAASAPAIAAHRIEVNLPGDLPLLQIDAVLMERVLVNLLENAAKYTPEDSAIHLTARERSDAVCLFVDDHGPGLPKGHEARVFEKFERGQRESATPGVGLGLAICRAIVEAHGGTIEGHTREHEGSVQGARFVIALPRGTPPADLGEPATPPETTSP